MSTTPLDRLLSSARTGGEGAIPLRDAIARMDSKATYHPRLWVGGEISDVSRARSGHHYFTLSDGGMQIPCVLWKHVARGIPLPPRDGLLVWINGWVQPHPERGYPELDVREIVLRSAQGPQRRATDELQTALAAEGLLDPARKRPLPDRIHSVAVVTSPAGDVVHDIRRILQQRAPHVDVELVPTRVSGEGAAREIAEAIRTVDRVGTASVILVARGGGSAADLRAFNEEVVARAVAESHLPVVTAIGHEPNLTLADRVADLSCATPSEAAARVAERALDPRAERASAEAGAAVGHATEFTIHVGGSRVSVRVDPRGDPS